MAETPKGEADFTKSQGSAEANFAARPRADSKFYAWLFLARRLKYLRINTGQSRFVRGRSEYTPDELTKCIYNPDVHTPKFGSKLLSIGELIALEHDAVIPKGLFRFPTDERAAFVECLTITVVIISFVLWPCTFIWGGSWKDPSLIPGQRKLLIADLICCDVVYAVCLLINFNMSYMHRRKSYEVVTRVRIRKHLLANPVFWLSMLSCTTYLWISLGAPMLLNNLKLIRVRHLLDVPDALWRLRDRSAVRLARPFVLLIGCAHWVACLLGYFGGYREKILQQGPDDFVTSFENHSIDGYWSLYLMALVEAVYMLTGALDNPVGDGWIREKQFGALLIVSIFGPVGCVVVALVIASIVREQSMATALNAKHEENKSFMQHAMRIMNIPKPLQNRVLSLHYYQKMGHDKEAFDALFNKKNLSRALENALLVYLYRDTVCTSKYFSNKDPNYIIEVLRILEFEVFIPGDYVGRRGEIASSMYFVSRGVCTILVPDPAHKSQVSRAKEVGTLKTGTYFGEIALVDDTVRTAWVRADSYAVLSALHRNAIEPIWKYFPQEREELQAVVLENRKKDKQRLNRHRWKLGFDAAKVLKRQVDVTDIELQAESEVPDEVPSDSGNGHTASNGQKAHRHRPSIGRASTDAGSISHRSSMRQDISDMLSRQAALEEQMKCILWTLRSKSEAIVFEKVENEKAPTQGSLQPAATKKPWKNAKKREKIEREKIDTKKDDATTSEKSDTKKDDASEALASTRTDFGGSIVATKAHGAQTAGRLSNHARVSRAL